MVWTQNMNLPGNYDKSHPTKRTGHRGLRSYLHTQDSGLQSPPLSTVRLPPKHIIGKNLRAWLTLHHFGNDGSWYVSSINLGTIFGKKGGHLLGSATSLCLHDLACAQADHGGGRRVG